VIEHVAGVIALGEQRRPSGLNLGRDLVQPDDPGGVEAPAGDQVQRPGLRADGGQPPAGVPHHLAPPGVHLRVTSPQFGGRLAERAVGGAVRGHRPPTIAAGGADSGTGPGGAEPLQCPRRCGMIGRPH
jgi:hypothetical protein